MGDRGELQWADATGGQVTPGDDTPIAVPSGQVVTLQDTVMNAPGPMGTVARFRFVAPGIAAGGGVDFETAAADMLHLCQSYALQRLDGVVPVPSQVIISLADRAVEFGEAHPDVTQFFEAYRIEDGACIWEAF